MKRKKKAGLHILLAMCVMFFCFSVTVYAAEGDVEINEANFPDQIFREYVSQEFDLNEDGCLDVSEIAKVKKIWCPMNEISASGKVFDLTGISYFTNLELLDCTQCNLETLDISKNTALKKLYCDYNELSSLDISKNTALEYLNCNENKLSDLDISKNTVLDDLNCSGNAITELDISNNRMLTGLDCSDNNLAEIDFQSNYMLQVFSCDGNKLTRLDISSLKNLEGFSCSNNYLTKLDLRSNEKLNFITCQNNYLTKLDVSNNGSIYHLNCRNNYLTSIDVSKTQIVTRDAIGLKCTGNLFDIELKENGTYDLSGLPDGFVLARASNWKGGTVRGNILTVNKGVRKVTYTYDCGRGYSEIFTLRAVPHCHRGTLVAGKQATCQTKGCKSYYICSCGRYFADSSCTKEITNKTSLEIPMTAHSYNAGVETKKATCISKGIKTYTCTVCSQTKTEETAKGPCSYDSGIITKKATCTAEGKKTYTCKLCKAVKTEIIARTAHCYKNVVKKATLSKNGKITPTCTACGATKKAEAIAHPKTVTLSKSSYAYNGKSKKPGVKVKDANGKTISSSNYKISYEKGRKNVGRYTVKLTFKGKYSGTKKLTFTINPAATELKTLIPEKKSITVKWAKRTEQVTGYQIQYSTDSGFAEAKTETVRIKKNAVTSQKLKDLKANKRYYVRIRTYKQTAGKNYYSAWSKVKKINTRK